jgi:hypothetical protein
MSKFQGILTEGEGSVHLTSFSSAAFDIADILYIFSKPATLTRRSIVPSFLFQLVFLGKFASKKVL